MIDLRLSHYITFTIIRTCLLFLSFLIPPPQPYAHTALHHEAPVRCLGRPSDHGVRAAGSSAGLRGRPLGVARDPRRLRAATTGTQLRHIAGATPVSEGTWNKES